MKVRPLFAWYDLWIGAYYDRSSGRLYILPIPCVGIVIDFGPPLLKCPDCGRPDCTGDDCPSPAYPPEVDCFGNYMDTREEWSCLVDAMRKRADAYGRNDAHAIGLWETTALAHVAMLIEKSRATAGRGSDAL